MDEEKLRVLLQKEPGEPIDPENDFFELGLLKMHGLIDEDMNITPQGEKVYNEIINNPDYGEEAEEK